MPTLAVHSFGNERNEYFEAFYRPDTASPGWFRSYGTLDRVAFEISVLLAFGGATAETLEFENRYGGYSDFGDFEKVVSAARSHVGGLSAK